MLIVLSRDYEVFVPVLHLWSIDHSYAHMQNTSDGFAATARIPGRLIPNDVNNLLAICMIASLIGALAEQMSLLSIGAYADLLLELVYARRCQEP